jgi:hypothetical protein
MTAKAEATASSLKIIFDGATYEIPPASEWDLDVIEYVEEGKITLACRALVGPDGWKTFRSKPRKIADLEGLFEAIQTGLGSGN